VTYLASTTQSPDVIASLTAKRDVGTRRATVTHRTGTRTSHCAGCGRCARLIKRVKFVGVLPFPLAFVA